MYLGIIAVENGVKIIMKPTLRSRISETIKKIISKNHEFHARELWVLWSDVIGTVAILALTKLLKNSRELKIWSA
jgi:hypothetical protein